MPIVECDVITRLFRARMGCLHSRRGGQWPSFQDGIQSVTMISAVTEERRILVVEDDGDLRHVYRLALSFAGFQVEEAVDGMDALRRLDADPPDLIILDLMLPDLSGLIVQEEVAAHAHTRNIPVVIVTGSDVDLDHVDVQCVLRKPITPEQLIETVRKCLDLGERTSA